MEIRADVSAQMKAVKEQQAQAANCEIPTTVIINGTSLENGDMTWAGIKQSLRDYSRSCRTCSRSYSRDVVEYVKCRMNSSGGPRAVIVVHGPGWL